MDPHFDDPPVVERVIGLQFDPLQFFTNAHAGWFWKLFLSQEWSSISEATSIANQIERFGEGSARPQRGLMQIAMGPSPGRHRIIRETDDRMIQIQNSRFHLNWRKKDGLEYPEFEELSREFVQYFGYFRDFVGQASEEEKLTLNQWEITYINHIRKGVLWKKIGDWFELFPGLSIPHLKANEEHLDTLGANWSIALKDNVGRLHIKLSHALAATDPTDEIVLLDLTARGPASNGNELEEVFQIGHESIVSTFTEITSQTAHKIWGKRS